MPREAPAERPVSTNLSLAARVRRALEYLAGLRSESHTAYVARLIVEDLERRGMTLADKRFDPPKEQSK